MATPTSADARVGVVELVCAEHLQRTFLACDEATAFQRIVSQAVVARHGQWTFEQYRPSGSVVLQQGAVDTWGALKNYTVGGDVRRVLERRDEFRRNEGLLLCRMATASKGIRHSAAALYTIGGPIA
ncbi:hypothetical protein DQ04_02411060 [Trypanosoma grayi]|uniref:hypothetical protein n=1 Tax=Trypanosoma grayi TaxID=71804 RepID=UPI0004F41266|nr:hypothetical protein DQ04_02411060 [Trypanosoma grayi]KEG11641.1 hypothetical protein DQ04_02411060 [Trypanosoma grayi]